MMNIIVLGDSFSYGQGCVDRPTIAKNKGLGPSAHAWPNLLRKDFPDDNIFNLSTPGNSMIGMFKDFTKFKDNVPQVKVDLVIATVTSFDRMMVTDHKGNITNWVLGSYDLKNSMQEPDEYYTAKGLYLKHLHNEDIQNFYSLAILLGLIQYTQHICGANIMWSVSDPHLVMGQDIHFDSVKGLHFYHMRNLHYLTDPQREDKDFVKQLHMDDGHPNEKAHQMYYDAYLRPQVVPRIREFLEQRKKVL